MNKLQTSVRRTVLKTVGKALTLCGVARTFAACYGTPPREPNPPGYWAQKNAEESLLGVHNAESQTNCERLQETPAEQESQNARSAQLQGE